MTAPWMPLYIGDYLKDTRRLTTLEHGAYLLLIMEYWQQGSLPTDDARLARVAGLSPAEWKSVRPAITPYFTDDWRHSRIEAELARSIEKSGKARNSASRRWAANGSNPPTHPNGEGNASEHANASAKAHANASAKAHADRGAKAMLSQSQSHPSLPSQGDEYLGGRLVVVQGGRP